MNSSKYIRFILVFLLFVVQKLETWLNIIGLHCITDAMIFAGVPLYHPLVGGTAVHLKANGQLSPSSFFFNRWIAPLDLPISSAQSRML